MVLTKNCQKVALGVIFEFFGSKTPYKQYDEVLKIIFRGFYVTHS